MTITVTMMKMVPDDAGAGGRPSESGLVSLHFHHDVMNVDELVFDFHSLEWVLVQDLLEAVVILDQLHQRPLQPVANNESAFKPTSHWLSRPWTGSLHSCL